MGWWGRRIIFSFVLYREFPQNELSWCISSIAFPIKGYKFHNIICILWHHIISYELYAKLYVWVLFFFDKKLEFNFFYRTTNNLKSQTDHLPHRPILAGFNDSCLPRIACHSPLVWIFHIFPGRNNMSMRFVRRCWWFLKFNFSVIQPLLGETFIVASVVFRLARSMDFYYFLWYINMRFWIFSKFQKFWLTKIDGKNINKV